MKRCARSLASTHDLSPRLPSWRQVELPLLLESPLAADQNLIPAPTSTRALLEIELLHFFLRVSRPAVLQSVIATLLLLLPLLPSPQPTAAIAHLRRRCVALRCVPSHSANLQSQIKIDQPRPLPSIAAANARPTPKPAAHLVQARAASWTIANPQQ